MVNIGGKGSEGIVLIKTLKEQKKKEKKKGGLKH